MGRGLRSGRQQEVSDQQATEGDRASDVAQAYIRPYRPAKEVEHMRTRLTFAAVAVAVVLGVMVSGAGTAAAATPTLSKTTGLHFYERATVHTGAGPGATVLIFQCFDVDGTAFDRCVPLART